MLPALPAGAPGYRRLKERAARSDAQGVDGPASGARRRRLRVGGKFTLAVGVLVLALVAIAATGWAGLARSDRQLDQVYTDNLQALARAFELVDVLHESELTALQLVQTSDPETEAQLDRRLDASLGHAAGAVQDMRDLFSDDAGAESVLDDVDAGLAGFTALRRTGAYGLTGPASDGEAGRRLTQRTLAAFEPLTVAVDDLHREEKAEAAEWRRQASEDEAATRRQLAVSVAVSLLGGVVIVLLLHRDVVPRIRRYADFATAIAAGRPAEPLDVRGSDELTELGLALNAMVEQRVRLQTQEHGQMEFVDTLQMTSSEDEAHDLITRHTERSLPGSTAVVLQSNNSGNRLQAATTLQPGSPLAGRLLGAEPRACLAVRFARTHQEREGVTPLLDCGVCGGLGRPSTCEPLLVSGSVIGALLVEQPLAEAGDVPDDLDHRIKTTVAQAAPVLANLRNLALAEFRANSDSLTGLPNRRATDDTLKRLVARANRSLVPLTAVIVDLDHFKQINDRFGHASGDEVLAAVGAALTACLRESDFAGRYGGEEFLVLLPDTDTEGAYLVAEKIRTTVAAIRVPGVDVDITASAGVADLLAHGGTATSMLREADRALYAAKADGRDRTVVASAGRATSPVTPPTVPVQAVAPSSSPSVG